MAADTVRIVGTGSGVWWKGLADGRGGPTSDKVSRNKRIAGESVRRRDGNLVEQATNRGAAERAILRMRENLFRRKNRKTLREKKTKPDQRADGLLVIRNTRVQISSGQSGLVLTRETVRYALPPIDQSTIWISIQLSQSTPLGSAGCWLSESEGESAPPRNTFCSTFSNRARLVITYI